MVISVAPSPAHASLLGRLLQVLRTATLERLILPDIEGREMDERIVREPHPVRTPPLPSAASGPPPL
jgi:hypothetical protein